MGHSDDPVQDYSNSSTLAMELLQSSTKPSIYPNVVVFYYEYFWEYICDVT